MDGKEVVQLVSGSCRWLCRGADKIIILGQDTNASPIDNLEY